MAGEIKVPDMGESIIEATVLRWLKNVGDAVKPGEPLVELETDKINLEVGAQQAGVLKEISRQAGDTVVVGDILGQVAEGGDGQNGGGGSGKETATSTAPIPEPASAAKEQPRPEASEVEKPAEPAPAAGGRVTPVAQRMAQEMGVDLSKVRPTGSGGQITKEDVRAYLDQAGAQPREAAPPVPAPPAPAPEPRPAAQAPAEPGRETRTRMSRRRQTIARRLVEAQHTAAMLTTFNEIDMTRVMDIRKRRRDEFKERYGVDLGFMSFFVKAVIGALKAFPMVNGEIQGDEIVLKHYYDIGIAVGVEEGLVVPVIRGADRMSFAEIERAVRDLAQKARDQTLTLDDLRGGTFTITNGGIYGSLMSTPILNPPQVGILGMHRIQERPVAVNKEIVIRPMMYVALSYDHRIVDGREAVQFLVRVKEMVEDPETMLLG